MHNSKEKHGVLFFGRGQPLHSGHEQAVHKVEEIAKKHNGTSHIVFSATHDSNKNPLTPEQKLKHAKRAFPNSNVEVATKEHPTLLHHLSKLHKSGVTHAHIVAGSDRIPGYEKLVHHYNGVESSHGHYNFKHISFHSSGERDANSKGTEGVSATKMREHAKSNNKSEFIKHVPSKMSHEHAEEMFNDVRNGLQSKPKKLKEELCMEYFKALFLVGGPGSGKDFLIHSTLNEFKLKEVSMERIFNAIIKETNIEELDNFPSIIVNGNADNMDKIIVTKAILETMGYDTGMVYVYTSDEVSKNRNDFRISKGAKTFSESVRKIKYDNSINNIEKYAEMFEGFVLYDNSNHFAIVNEEKKTEITSWLLELSEVIEGFLGKQPKNESAVNWIAEKEMNKIQILKQRPDKKNDDKDGGGVAYAGKNSTSKETQDESVKIIKKVSNPIGKYKTIPPHDYGSSSVSNSYNTGDIGVSSSTGQTEEVDKKKKNKIYPAKDIGEIGGKEGGVGGYVPSVGGIQEKTESKKKSFKDFKGNKFPTSYGNAQSFGSDAVGGFPSLREEKKDKKKTKKISDNPETQGLNGMGIGNNVGQETLTATIPESKSFDRIRNIISATANNFDEELK